MSAMAMEELFRLEMPTATIRLVTLRIGDGNNTKQLILGQAGLTALLLTKNSQAGRASLADAHVRRSEPWYADTRRRRKIGENYEFEYNFIPLHYKLTRIMKNEYFRQ